MGNLYNVETNIQTKLSGHDESESSESSEDSRGNTSLSVSRSDRQDNHTETEGTLGTALEKIKIESTTDSNSNTSNISDLVNCFWSNNERKPPLYHVEPSQPSPQVKASTTSVAAETTVVKSIYRIERHSDTFACNYCRLRGDKWEMRQHLCKGSKK